MGLQMGITIFLFVWGGQQLDQYLKFRFPVFTIFGSLAGLGLALYFVIRNVNNPKKQQP
jgi:hypothetical protein